MKLKVAWALCDVLKTVILAAHSNWAVEVLVDAQRDVRTLPDPDSVEVHLGPITSEEARPEGSRIVVQGEIAIAIRMRVKLDKLSADDAARAKCEAWDQLVDVIQRREGFDCGSAGTLHWFHGVAGIDLSALRKDKVISILCPQALFHEIRQTARGS